MRSTLLFKELEIIFFEKKCLCHVNVNNTREKIKNCLKIHNYTTKGDVIDLIKYWYSKRENLYSNWLEVTIPLLQVTGIGHKNFSKKIQSDIVTEAYRLSDGCCVAEVDTGSALQIFFDNPEEDTLYENYTR